MRLLLAYDKLTKYAMFEKKNCFWSNRVEWNLGGI